MFIKREYDYTMDNYSTEDDLGEGSSSDPYIRISGVTNENWRGKNDPTERRRIQNRLNQRAFRQRQRAGEPPKQYKPRSSSAGTSSGPDDDGLSTPPPEESQPGDSRATSAPVTSQPIGSSDSSGRVWDELARLINRNLMSAASTNAQKLGIDMDSLRSGTPALTPPTASNTVPAALQLIQLQRQVPHDPMVDIIPHPRLRFNILRAIATRQLDGAAFSRHLRASGGLQYWQEQEQWLRGGLIVWSSPEQVSSWELSELFLHAYGGLLLPGCEDLLAATNAWRGRRGERLFPASIPP